MTEPRSSLNSMFSFERYHDRSEIQDTMAETATATAPKSAGPVRKKFATPPVKIACLACRASRTRCDGTSPCSSCKSKERECVYKPSRRGGARVRKKHRANGDLKTAIDIFNDEFQAKPQEPLEIQGFTDPGAGLKRLGDVIQDSDFIFDSLFMTESPAMPSSENISVDESMKVLQPQAGPMVRTYTNDQAILEAYYIWIHPYFPILPPPEMTAPADHVVPLIQNRPEQLESSYEPSSPIGLALSALLALIPCPQDPNYLAEDSVLFRRKYAQFLAQSAMESIEIESEIPESAVEPNRALGETSTGAHRQPFHHRVPLELESIIALDLLSVYEYGQRGNLKKMQNRAGQALVSAMNLSLHTGSSREDEFAEAKNRVWWMTYICNCQVSIVSNSRPSFAVFAPAFKAKMPLIQSDPEAWGIFIQAQQTILAATQFVIDLNKAVETEADMHPIYEQMKKLELTLEPLATKAENWIMDCPLTAPMDPTERVLGQSLRCMARIKINSARIKIHRYCAFYDMPLFSSKHCDLKAIGQTDFEGQEPRRWPTCSCGTFTSLPTPNNGTPPFNGQQQRSTPFAMQNSPNSSDDGSTNGNTAFPFSGHYSAKICLKSALDITQAFDLLPYPNPCGSLCPAPPYLSSTSAIIAPRTMPSFACCAMQSAYALLMVHQRTVSMYPDPSQAGGYVTNLLAQLQGGILSIMATLENYSTAFEALGGMRDQIRMTVESSNVFDV